MHLRYSPTSPYARKVIVCAKELGLDGSITLTPTNPWDPASDIGQDNPLGKVPTLVLDDGRTLFDSRVICEFLQSLEAETTLFPKTGEARWQSLRLQSLADGIMDAAVLIFLENSRREEEKRSDWWLNLQMKGISQSVDEMERLAGQLQDPPGIGEIATGCALAYLDLRIDNFPWRQQAPALANWYGNFAQRQSMRSTTPD